MKKIIAFCLVLAHSVAHAQFSPGQTLTAAELNSAFAAKTTNAAAAITGGTIDNAVIGGTTPAAGTFATLSVTGSATLPSVTISGGSITGTPISGSTGVFTTLTTSGKLTTYNGVATVANGIASLYGQANPGPQSTSLTSSTLYAVPASGAGLYVIIVDNVCSTAGTGGTVSTTIGWNNGAASANATTGGMSLTTLGNEATQIFIVYSAASQNITYSTTVTGAAGAPQYTVRLRVIYLG